MSTATAAAMTAGPAAAQTQSGLVNVDLSGNTVQVPIAVAANVCGVQAGVLAQQLAQGPTTCNSASNGLANISPTTGTGGGGGGTQQGLVNLSVTNNTVQIPLGIAANICGVQAGVLAQQLVQGATGCTAMTNTGAGA